MRVKPPCKLPDGTDCPNRHVGCRDNCDAWQEWVKAHEAEVNQIKTAKYGKAAVDGFLVEREKRARTAACRKYQQSRRRQG